MNVRWQHRAAHLRKKDQGHWAAILVENVRARDKWTERVVAYLAGIGKRDITKLGAQCGFWERVAASSIDWATASLLKIAGASSKYYKKECRVRRGCNTISGIVRECDYSEQIG